MKYYITSRISENIHETPEGYLLCMGVPIARTGEMVYGEGETPLEVGDDGRVIITRTPEEVFRPETIASFEGKAVTITHPTEFVGPSNWSTLAKGILQNVRQGEGEQENDLLADLLITDSMAIALVKNGLREVSCGYEAEYIQTESGRGSQTKIVGNHLALVREGRAGASYAINDHKGKGATKMKLSDKIKAIFAKAQDEALKVASDEAGSEEADKDAGKEKSKDASGQSYDELVKMVKDLGEKIGALAPKGKDESSKSKKDDDKEKTGDEEVAPSLEERLKVLEAAVQKLLEREAKEDEVPVGDEDGDEEDDIEEESEEAEDDVEEAVLTGDAATDTISRAEILAPGIKHTKDVKVKALKSAYATKDGKKIIESLTGGKAPTFDSKEKVDTLFIAASELMKVSRANDFSKTKTRDYNSVLESREGAMTAEKLNEINAKHYNQGK